MIPTVSLKKYMYGARPELVQKNWVKSQSDKKLGHHLNSLSSSAKASGMKSHEHDDLLLDHSNSGLMETETDMERTWKVKQDEIVESSAIATASKSFSLKLEEFGPYAVDYTRNGR